MNARKCVTLASEQGTCGSWARSCIGRIDGNAHGSLHGQGVRKAFDGGDFDTDRGDARADPQPPPGEMQNQRTAFRRCQIVRADDDAAALCCKDFPPTPDFMSRCHIEPRRRLVEQQQAPGRQHRGGKRQNVR